MDDVADGYLLGKIGNAQPEKEHGSDTSEVSVIDSAAPDQASRILL